MKKNIFSTIALCLSIGYVFNACNCEDIISLETQWNNIKTKPILEGTVYTVGNKPLANAQVTIVANGKEHTYTSDENGLLSITDLDAGTYNVSVSYPVDPTFTSNQQTVVLEDNTTSYVNVLLYPMNTTVETTTSAIGTLYSIALPDVVHTNTSKSQMVCFDVPGGALDPEDALILSTKYDIRKSVVRTDYYLSGNDIVIICDSKTVLGKDTLKKNILIYAYGLCEPSAVYHNGVKVKFNYNDNENGRYYFFSATEVGTTEFHFPIKISEHEIHMEPVTFGQREFEGEEKHISTTYKYQTGTDVNLSNTYLDQYVILLHGSTKSESKVSTFEQDIYIPKGEKVVVSGLQVVTSFNYACGVTSDSVVQYGKIYTQVSDRMHTGGSSK